ncbi:hypothetical protein [Spirochaeta dissipatitropha]
MKTKYKWILASALILIFAVTGCSNFIGGGGADETLLIISLQPDQSRTVLPSPVDIEDIDYYVLRLSREGYDDIEETLVSFAEPVEIPGIAIGEWQLVIEAYLEGQSGPSFGGQEFVEINLGTNSVKMSLLPLREAVGELDIVVEWPSELVDNVSVFRANSIGDLPGQIMDPEDFDYELSVAGDPGIGRLTIQLGDEPSGSFIATVRLYKNSEVVAEIIEVVRIYDHQLSQAYIQLESSDLSQPPSAPMNVQAAPIRDQDFYLEGIELTWQDSASTETGYRVYRSLNGAAWDPIAGALDANSESYVDELIDLMLGSGTTIQYRVESFNSFGSSDEVPSDQLDFYILTFDANGGFGGQGSIETRLVSAGEGFMLPNDIFSRGVYFFDGWAVEAEAETYDYDFGESYTMPANDIDFFAFWTAPLLIPDAYNERIVLLRDISGADRQVIDAAQLDWTGGFHPTDVEIDAQGRIYAAVSTVQNYPGEYTTALAEYSDSEIIRLLDADSTTYEVMYSKAYSDIFAITMDPAGEYLYFGDVDGYLQLNRLRTSDGDVTTINTYMYDSLRGIAYAESGGNTYLFAAEKSDLYRFDITTFVDEPDVISESQGGDLFSFDNMFGDIAWIGSALQVIATPNPGVGGTHNIDPLLLTLDINLELQSSVGSKGDPDIDGQGFFLFPQRFVGVYKNEDIYVTDGGGFVLDGFPVDQDPGHLIRLRHEEDAVTEWETYADSEAFGFEGYNLYITS